MAMPYVISILVASGDPDGVRIVEKSNWTGRGVMFGQADLAEALRHEIGGPGVYVLVGDDDSEEFDVQVYVGQAEDVGKRLKQHLRDQAKDFWSQTVVFDSPIGSLNRAHISLIESKLIELGREARRGRVANGNLPAVPHLSAIDAAVAEGFLAEMKAIMPALGLAVFEVPQKHRLPRAMRRSTRSRDLRRRVQALSAPMDSWSLLERSLAGRARTL